MRRSDIVELTRTAKICELPFLVGPPQEPRSLLAVVERRTDLCKQLLTHGALLFRGYGVDGILGFETFCREFAQGELMDYSGGASPRKRLGKKPVYTSTEYSSELTIPLHNELSYSPAFPKYVFFWCDIAPTDGGETLLGDSRMILKDMPPEIVDELESKKISYIRNLISDPTSAYSWQHVFCTANRSEVEARCDAMGAAYNWMDNDRLRIEQIGPATLVHPKTNERVWFNQADGFYSDDRSSAGLPRLDVRFGDGWHIPFGTIAQIRSVIEKRTTLHRWQRNDVLVIDNILAAHGRAPFIGQRSIAVAMA